MTERDILLVTSGCMNNLSDVCQVGLGKIYDSFRWRIIGAGGLFGYISRVYWVTQQMQILSNLRQLVPQIRIFRRAKRRLPEIETTTDVLKRTPYSAALFLESDYSRHSIFEVRQEKRKKCK